MGLHVNISGRGCCGILGWEGPVNLVSRTPCGHLAQVGLVLGHPLPAFLHPVLASQSLLVRLVLLGLLVLPLPLLLKFLQVLRLLHVQSWLCRHPTLSTSSPTLTTIGTPSSTPTALLRLPTAQRQPSPSRPTIWSWTERERQAPSPLAQVSQAFHVA